MMIFSYVCFPIGSIGWGVLQRSLDLQCIHIRRHRHYRRKRMLPRHPGIRNDIKISNIHEKSDSIFDTKNYSLEFARLKL